MHMYGIAVYEKYGHEPETWLAHSGGAARRFFTIEEAKIWLAEEGPKDSPTHRYEVDDLPYGMLRVPTLYEVTIKKLVAALKGECSRDEALNEANYLIEMEQWGDDVGPLFRVPAPYDAYYDSKQLMSHDEFVTKLIQVAVQEEYVATPLSNSWAEGTWEEWVGGIVKQTCKAQLVLPEEPKQEKVDEYDSSSG